MEILPIYNSNKSEDLKSLSPANPSRNKGIDREKLKKSCTEFESLLIYQMLRLMRQAMLTEGSTEGGLGKGVYHSLFDQELSECLAKREGFGLGKMIYEQVVGREDRRRPETEAEQKGTRSPSELVRGETSEISGK